MTTTEKVVIKRRLTRIYFTEGRWWHHKPTGGVDARAWSFCQVLNFKRRKERDESG